MRGRPDADFTPPPAPPAPSPPRQGPLCSAGDPIVIGLVNNMPDSALRSTERQFTELLAEGAQGRAIRLRWFSLPELPRGEAARSHLDGRYEAIERLWAGAIDGLIVTGNEPCAARLPDEPYWPSLARLVDWAHDHTISTVWSCLAAHAAVLHLDGIGRKQLPDKLVGVFDCRKTATHPLTRGTPQHWRMPHSRHNELPQAALVASGYDILSSSREAGVDMFARPGGSSLFVFFQGHPEYDVGALGREYRRDVGRFFAGRMTTYPAPPQHYFDMPTMHLLDGVRQRRAELPAVSPAGELADAWHRPAVQLYANWLSYLAARKPASHPAPRIDAPLLECVAN